MKVTVIWDTDGQVIDDLPTIIDIPDDITENYVADYLSDEYGWLVESWEEYED